MWRSLISIHEECGHQTATTVHCALTQTHAEEGDDIIAHVHKLKEYWERLNMFNAPAFTVPDQHFKGIIGSSLPPSWDNFIQPYVNKRVGEESKDPREDTSSQDFIGVINEEYKRRKGITDAEKTAEHSYVTQWASFQKCKYGTAFSAPNQSVASTSK